MGWPEIFLIGKVIIVIDIVIGISLYLFMGTLIRDPKNGTPIMSKDSWHCKIAYPFKRHHGTAISTWPLSKNIFTYILKILWMLSVIWPILLVFISGQIIIFTPFMILFGSYPLPSLKAMATDSPLAVRVKSFYIPKTAEDFPILPIFPVLVMTYIWLLEKMTLWIVLLTTALVVIIGSLFLYRFLKQSEIIIPKAKQWYDSKAKIFMKNLSKRIKKYNYPIEIKDRK